LFELYIIFTVQDIYSTLVGIIFLIFIPHFLLFII
jgi:hypothetical protein